MEIITAQMFVDWDSARRILRPPWGEKTLDIALRDRARYVEKSFHELQVRTVSAIETMKLPLPLRVVVSRIYHGWHRGASATDDRRAWEQARSKFTPYITRNVSYLPDIQFGDQLTCGGSRVPLLDTLRRREDGIDHQKMVDTALVADLLSFARTESANFRRGERPRSMAVIIGNDDDLLPGSIVVEQWGLPVKVLRVNRDRESRFLRLSELVHSL